VVKPPWCALTRKRLGMDLWRWKPNRPGPLSPTPSAREGDASPPFLCAPKGGRGGCVMEACGGAFKPPPPIRRGALRTSGTSPERLRAHAMRPYRETLPQLRPSGGAKPYHAKPHPRLPRGRRKISRPSIFSRYMEHPVFIAQWNLSPLYGQ
jgi:hypothetical protein